jgi:hypothetical protein
MANIKKRLPSGRRKSSQEGNKRTNKSIPSPPKSNIRNISQLLSPRTPRGERFTYPPCVTPKSTSRKAAFRGFDNSEDEYFPSQTMRKQVLPSPSATPVHKRPISSSLTDSISPIDRDVKIISVQLANLRVHSWTNEERVILVVLRRFFHISWISIAKILNGLFYLKEEAGFSSSNRGFFREGNVRSQFQEMSNGKGSAQSQQDWHTIWEVLNFKQAQI